MPENVTRIGRWVRSGPDGHDGTIGWFVGMLCWWRIWAFGLTLVLPLVALVSFTQGPFIAYIAGVFVGGWLMKLSPKYEITKNY